MPNPTPRDFPVLWTVAEAKKLRKNHQRCSVCGLAVQPRNRARHIKACARRKRQDPRMWNEWRYDMLHPGNDDNPHINPKEEQR